MLLSGPYNSAVNQVYKTLPYVRYSATHRAWYIKKSRTQLQQLSTALAGNDIAQTNERD